MEFWAALVGAVVGGGATFAASWWQTGKVLKHERAMAADARADEAAERRIEEIRTAGAALLAELSDFLSREKERLGDGATSDRWRSYNATVSRMRIHNGGTAPLAESSCRARWGHLVRLAEQFPGIPVSERPGDPATTGAGSRSAKRRAEQDLMRYGRYVRDSLIASIDQMPVPGEIAPPDFGVETQAVWNWDPERQNRDW